MYDRFPATGKDLRVQRRLGAGCESSVCWTLRLMGAGSDSHWLKTWKKINKNFNSPEYGRLWSFLINMESEEKGTVVDALAVVLYFFLHYKFSHLTYRQGQLWVKAGKTGLEFLYKKENK